MSSTDDIRSFVDTNWNAIKKDIADMVAIPSVRDDEHATEDAPFGPEPRRALDEIGKIAKRLGLDVLPCDNYCCVADLKGVDDKEIAVVAHVDVVPAGPGWHTDPFEMVERDGYLLGRGVEDDKGPGVIGLWAAHWFVDQGIVPQHKIRFIFGSDEESGMGGVKKYVAENPQPDFMFTPDADFPVICGEKGIMQGEVSFPFPASSRIKEIHGGVAHNAVAGSCEAIVEASLDELVPSSHISYEKIEDGLVRIVAAGVSGHASLPEGTSNAIGILVEYLKSLGFVQEAEMPWYDFEHKLMVDAYGEALGIACEEEFLGKLTCVGGVLNIKDGKGVQSIDIRYPCAITQDALSARFTEIAEGLGGTFAVDHAEDSHLVDPEDECVVALVDAYREVSGKQAEPIAIGGGTYAKRFKRSVAFGPADMTEVKPEWAGGMHGPDESMNEELLKEALVVYIRSLENLNAIEF